MVLQEKQTKNKSRGNIGRVEKTRIEVRRLTTRRWSGEKEEKADWGGGPEAEGEA